jgi:hypothetical protein
VGLALLDWLQLPAPVPPNVAGRLPWPTTLLLGGLLLRVLLGLLRRRLLDRGAHRHQEEVAAELQEEVERVADERIVRPLRAELDVHDLLRDILERLAR